jgi:hypothetical protein
MTMNQWCLQAPGNLFNKKRKKDGTHFFGGLLAWVYL